MKPRILLKGPQTFLKHEIETNFCTIRIQNIGVSLKKSHDILQRPQNEDYQLTATTHA